MDVNLQEMLRHEVYVERPEVRFVDGDVATPRYVTDGEARRALVQPVKAETRETVAGKWEEATHVVYLGAEDEVRAGDVLVRGACRYEVVGVEDEGGQGHHWRVWVREAWMSDGSE